MLKPPEEHTTGSDSVPLGLVACCVGVEVPAAMYRREVSVCVDGHQRTQATGLPAIGCCFLFLSAATRHTDAWQHSLADYVQAALMLNYNQRSVG